MKVVVFRTAVEKERGLQHMTEIPDDTVWVFTAIQPGTQFHSRNVPEPFEVAFLDWELRLLAKHRVVPPAESIYAPPGTVYAVEAKDGVLVRFLV